MVIYAMLFGAVVCFNLLHIVIAIMGIILFYVIMVKWSIRKFLKKSIVELIV